MKNFIQPDLVKRIKLCNLLSTFQSTTNFGLNINYIKINHSGLWMMITEILVLTYRNLVASIDKVFLIWQIIFPILYIFISGYSYSAYWEIRGYE